MVVGNLAFKVTNGKFYDLFLETNCMDSTKVLKIFVPKTKDFRQDKGFTCNRYNACVGIYLS